MKHPFLLIGLFLLGGLSSGALHAQESGPGNVENGFRNRFSYQAPSVATPGGVTPPPPLDPLNAAYIAQGQSGTAFGGWSTLRILNASGTVVAGSPTLTPGATALVYPKSSGTSGVELRSAIMGRPLVVFAIAYNFGAVIPPPGTSENGTPLAGDFYLDEPANAYTTAARTTLNPDFYWSTHAQKVFATKAGSVEIRWKERNSTMTRSVTYVVANSPEKPEQTLFWTENGFKGPLVSVPQTKVNQVNFVYNSLVPAEVDTPYEPWIAGAITPQDLVNTKYRTVYYGLQDNLLHAYNVEGRVFMEYLGNPLGGGRSEHLGFEIVNVVKERTPETRMVELGEPVLPSIDPESPPGQETRLPLSPRVSAGAGLGAAAYLYEHVAFGGSQRTHYAIRQTLPGVVVEGEVVQLNNEVLIYWMEKGERDVEWPKEYATYIIDWPADPAKFSVYARPDAGTPEGLAESGATSVRLNSADSPTLVHQDDPSGEQAILEPGGIFHTNVTAADPVNRALLRFTNGDDIWFECVFSQLDPYYKNPSTVIQNRVRRLQTSVPADFSGSGWNIPTGFPNISNVVVTDPANPNTAYTLGTHFTVSAAGVVSLLSAGGLRTLPAVQITFDAPALLPFASNPGTPPNVDIGTRIRPDPKTVTAGLDPVSQSYATGYSDITDVAVTSPGGVSHVEGTDYALDAVNGKITKKEGRMAGVTSVTITFRPFYAGYIYQRSGTAFNVKAYQDPFEVGFEEAAKGAIIGVNNLAANNQLEVWWYKKSLPSSAVISGTYWPSSVQKYTLQWPILPDKIVLAENKGSDDLPSLQVRGEIYYQNEATLPGFNPNEEHAIMANGRAWALRDDLNLAASSLPYVLVHYTEADQRPAMHVFKVERGKFEYPAVAGVVLQAPMPLPILPPPFLPSVNGAPPVLASYEIQPAVSDPPAGTPDFTGADGTFQHYEKFTWTDRKGTVWVYRGPHGTGKIYSVLITNPGSGYVTAPSVTFSGSPGTGATATTTIAGGVVTAVNITNNGNGYVNPTVTFGIPPAGGVRATGRVTAFSMRYFYQTQAGFFFPEKATQPPVGTITPYLRRGSFGAWNGDAVTGEVATAGGRKEQPLDIVFVPEWPKYAPELRVGETLALPKLGLPSVRGQSSAEFIYQQSIALDATGLMANRQKSARLFDPTRAKVYPLGGLQSPDWEKNNLPKIPEGVNTSIFLGKTYFPNLPPHLSGRLYFDPAVGRYGSLVFKGQFMDELFGEKYLQLNVMSAADVTSALELAPKGTDTESVNLKRQWDEAIDSLATTMETFVEDPAKKGTFIPVTNELETPRYNIISGVKNLITPGREPLIATLAPDAERPMPGASWPAGMRPPLDKGELAEVFYSDTAVDSYAVSASGGGKGYVVLAAGNGVDTDFTPSGEPVSLHVFKVNAPLYRGELKVINSANPLDEKLTLQHTGDFAGHPEEYDFEWRYGPPVDGLPPSLYSFARKLIVPAVPAGSWQVIHNPVSDPAFPAENYTNYRSPGAEPDKEVDSVVVTNGGSDYTTPPDVTISGGGGSGAEAEAFIQNGSVVKVIVTRRGIGYTSDPSVAFSGGGGSGAAATARRSGSAATSGNTAMTIKPNDGNGTAGAGVSRPHAILRQQFEATLRPMRLFLSLDLGRSLGAAVYLNGAPVAAWEVPGQEDTAPASVPATVPPFDPLPIVFEIDPNTLKIAPDNVFTIELYSSANAGSDATVNLRLEGSKDVENLTGWLALGASAGESASPLSTKNNDAAAPYNINLVAIEGKNRHTIQGNSILTLTDNYFIVRYRAKNPANAAYVLDAGWSKWTEPQLAEGWIKRALAGINPFQQRVKDLFNNAVNTDVSLVQQAGKRWEGDIPLNLKNINDYGLIEIYETILRRGKTLSIDGTPRINYPGANDALLLASGYLSDLYMILGNEAYADAANPTIAFNDAAATQYGDVATSLYAFKGQLASMLDEELALLRGRDDFLLPGTKRTPVHNRLVWNYTRGIDAGEAIYALNYNIKDVAWDYSINPNNLTNESFDGVISAADAATLYPQGHGDAYGHYLTALTGYYGLLHNSYFSWTPRIEAVLVLGVPVSVDYQDERKFAASAVALTRTAGEITALTYRQEFSADENAGWEALRDEKPNANTGVVREWGTDDWACRGGQGALFHWATANSLLPAVDPDPAHSGIQKIDRTTVPELAELATQAAAIQQTLDNADARLNPLGLGNTALSFDISPAEVDAGKTHFEQIYQRSVVAVQNAVSAFNNAKNSTQFLRRQEDSLADQRAAILAQERAYSNQLIELYGTPYTDDIGPGKTYPQDYAGPDLYHAQYVEITENLGRENFTSVGGVDYTLYLKLQPDLLGVDFTGGIPDGISQPVTFHLNAINGEMTKPASWTGRRVSPGRIQTAVSDYLLARQEFNGALYDYDRLVDEMLDSLKLYNSALKAHIASTTLTEANNIAQKIMEEAEAMLAGVIATAETTEDAADQATLGTALTGPLVVGVDNDPSSAARAAAFAAAPAVKSPVSIGKITAKIALKTSELARLALNNVLELSLSELAWERENAQLITDLQNKLQEYAGNGSAAIDLAYRKIDQAERNLLAVLAEGDRIQKQRLVFRQHASGLIQGYRTRDFAFRAFRNEALERYRALFDLAARYTYMAAKSYDYETGLLNPTGNSAATGFYEKVIKARSLGAVILGQPQFAGASTGDPGLSGVLAAMSGDWSVVKTRLGFNNPDRYRTTFSLRGENFRIIPGQEGDGPWKDRLSAATLSNILDDPDVSRHAMQAGDPAGLAVPGIVLEFDSMIANGHNFFGQPLAAGDHAFSPTSFATKIRSSGIAFKGYVGMDDPSLVGGALGGIGAVTPPDPNLGWNDPQGLSATPYVYLIPAGVDSMRSPPLGDVSTIRSWTVEDQAVPLPFNIANSDYSTQPAWVTASSLSEPPFTLRKHQAFRAVPDGTVFSSAPGFTNARLVGRSVWNSRWKLVIPGNTLLADPVRGLEAFKETVKDIKLHLETYSYSGN